MGKRAVLYDLHILGTPTEPAERYEFDDPAKAVIGYNRLACERRRRAVLSKAGHLPGMEAEIIGSYIPDPDAPPIVHLVAGSGAPWAEVSGRPIMVRLGDPQPAFPREQAEREERDETPAQQRERRARNEMEQAAYWYARGVIDCIGGLSPFDNDDAAAFSLWHAETASASWHAKRDVLGIAEQWAAWSARRREEIGK